MNRYTVPLALFAAMVVLFAVGLFIDPRLVPSPFIDKPLPAFSLPRLDDPAARFTERDLQRRPALLNVWASWCPPCRQEHGLLLRLAREDGIALYGINYKDRREDALRWLHELGDPFLASASDLQGRTSIDLGVYGVPETFVVDAGGRIRYKHVGPLTEEVVQQKLLPLLREAAAPAADDRG